MFANFPKIHYRICRPLHATPISPIWTQLWTSYISVGNMSFWMHTLSTNPRYDIQIQSLAVSELLHAICSTIGSLGTLDSQNKLVLKCWNSCHIAIIIPARYIHKKNCVYTSLSKETRIRRPSTRQPMLAQATAFWIVAQRRESQRFFQMLLSPTDFCRQARSQKSTVCVEDCISGTMPDCQAACRSSSP